MDIISDLAKGAASGVFQGIGDLAKDIREAFTGKSIIDPTKEAELREKLMELQFAATKAQTDIDVAEARNPNIFVAGWRPAVGWVCVLGLVYQFAACPLLSWLSAMPGVHVPIPPALDTSTLTPLLLSLLGMGSLRTVEKIKGAAGNH